MGVSAVRATGRSREKVTSLRALGTAGRSLVSALSRIVGVRERKERGHQRTRTRLHGVRGRLGTGLLRVEKWDFLT